MLPHYKQIQIADVKVHVLCLCYIVAGLTSSSSATLDSLRAVGKTRGVNVTWMFPEDLGAGSSSDRVLLFAPQLPLRSRHNNMTIGKVEWQVRTMRI